MALSKVEGLRGVRGRDPRLKFWCGPTAISAVTGIDYYKACASISMVRGEAFRNTSQLGELQRVLEQRGYECESWSVSKGLTFREWLLGRPTPTHPDTKYIVLVTGHFIAVAGDVVCDSQYTRGIPTHWHDMKRGLQTEVVMILAIYPPAKD